MNSVTNKGSFSYNSFVKFHDYKKILETQYDHVISEIVSEYDQEIPQSQTADNPAWQGEEEPLNYHETPGRQIKQRNQLSLSHQDDCNTRMDIIVGHPEPEKKILLAFLSTFWHPCSKCILMCFKKDRGGCQVWKCPKVPELGQRSTECKFLYIPQILAFLSISYP